MNSFTALGNVKQATLALVAPGIAEALIATAMGLFAAIPAVVFYNKLSADSDRIVASSYQRRRHVWTLINGGPESAIYRSTDAGENWEHIYQLPEGAYERFGNYPYGTHLLEDPSPARRKSRRRRARRRRCRRRGRCRR